MLAAAPARHCANVRGLLRNKGLFRELGFFFRNGTGKSLSEALISASTNSQYDNRLFIELHENSKLKPGQTPPLWRDLVKISRIKLIFFVGTH